MVSAFISRVIILVFGTLYPAYASYKAVKNKNVKEYVKWMMYWIVFALFISVETFTDVFLSWLPFYYEIKIVFVLWLLSPATKGASILYRKFVHPQFVKREEKIDSYIAQASDKGYTALLTVGSKGLSYATDVVLKTAVKGQAVVVEHMQKSYSMNDLSVTRLQPERPLQPLSEDVEREIDEIDNRMLEDRNRTNEMLRNNDRHNIRSQGLDSVDEHEVEEVDAMDLHNVPEHTQDDNVMNLRSARSSSRAYKHEEASHYGTLPRRQGNRAGAKK